MQTAQHRVNSDFGLRHFLAGSCSTPDGAWALLYGQQIDMQRRLNAAEAAVLRHQAVQARAGSWANRLLALVLPSARAKQLEAQADLLEADANAVIAGRNLEGAKAELATIERMMDELAPHCVHAHLPLLDRLEACRRDEWAGELTRRGENMMLGAALNIPYDQLDAMRQSPDFGAKILPSLLKTGAAIAHAQRTGTSLPIEQALCAPALPFLKD